MKKWLLFWMLGISVYAQIPFVDAGFGVSIGSVAEDNAQGTKTQYGAHVYAGVWKLRVEPGFYSASLQEYDTKTISADVKYEIASAMITKVFVGGGYQVSYLDIKSQGFAGKYKVAPCQGFNINFSGEASLLFMKIFATAKYIRSQVANLDNYTGVDIVNFRRKAVNMYSVGIGVRYNLL